MEYFNFSDLPLLVKEMIADEIVHDSIPEDRIQFATTCKAFNQLVKHAKPRKIIRELWVSCRKTDVSYYINSGNLHKNTLSELKKILPQCQVEKLSLYATDCIIDEHLFAELMDLLMEPCRFLTVLIIDFDSQKFKYVDLYKNMRHLKSLTINDSTEMIMDLPHFPPRLELQGDYSLSLLAEKTLNHPLSFLKITEEVPLADFQQFLLTANLEIGAEIHFCFENQSEAFEGFLTIIGHGLFEFEMHRASRYLTLDQEMSSQNVKNFKVSVNFCLCCDEELPFTVTSVSNPDNVVCSGELTCESREKIVSENVAEIVCVKIHFPYRDCSTYYSSQLLDNWFPRTENYDPYERVKTINKTLGTNISVIKPEMLEEITKNPAV